MNRLPEAWPGLLVVLLACFASSVEAAADCYEIGNVPVEKRSYSSSAVVLLDETVVFDETQRAHIREIVQSMVAFGKELRVFTFSAFRDDRYTSPVMDFRLALPLDESARYAMRKDSVRAFDTCQQASKRGAKEQLEAVLNHYFERSSSKLANSEIFGTLKAIGDSVFPTLRSKSKRLVLVSDMLENSDISKFYSAGGGPRVIDVGFEISNVERKRLLTNFQHATVYVIGAAVVPATAKGSNSTYRSQSVLIPLTAFWTQYFEMSNARMGEFGQPLLLAPIGGKQ